MGTHVTTWFFMSLLAVVSLGYLGFSLFLCIKRHFVVSTPATTQVLFCQDCACSHCQVGRSSYGETRTGLCNHPSGTDSNAATSRAQEAR